MKIDWKGILILSFSLASCAPNSQSESLVESTKPTVCEAQENPSEHAGEEFHINGRLHLTNYDGASISMTPCGRYVLLGRLSASPECTAFGAALNTLNNSGPAPVSASLYGTFGRLGSITVFNISRCESFTY